MLALGSLVTVPFLSFVTTNIRVERNVDKKVVGLYTAEAGIEDGLWKIKYTNLPPLPYTYTLTGINGMSVTVTIKQVTTIAGEPVGASGPHEGWLKIEKSVSYNSGIYYYTMSLDDAGGGNTKVDKILVDFPPGFTYVSGSTSGDFASGNNSLSIYGSPDAGITLVWNLPSPYPSIPSPKGYHRFNLSGAAGLEGAEGHSFVRATREDIGTVWDSDSRPYSITAQSKDAANAVMATIEAGTWSGSSFLEIASWQVSQ